MPMLVNKLIFRIIPQRSPFFLRPILKTAFNAVSARMLDPRLKVHAEIQLLLYHDARPAKLRPRVICSGKRACYLCYLFMVFCGHYEPGVSHGKLYPMWSLPWIPFAFFR